MAARAHAADALGKAGHGGVVVDVDGLVEVLLQLGAQRHVAPAQVGAEDHVARLFIGHAGDAHADGGDVLFLKAAARHHIQHAAAHVRDDVLVGAARQRGGFALGEDGAAFVHHADLDAGAAQINADIDHRKASLLSQV